MSSGAIEESRVVRYQPLRRRRWNGRGRASPVTSSTSLRARSCIISRAARWQCGRGIDMSEAMDATLEAVEHHRLLDARRPVIMADLLAR